MAFLASGQGRFFRGKENSCGVIALVTLGGLAAAGARPRLDAAFRPQHHRRLRDPLGIQPAPPESGVVMDFNHRHRREVC